MRQNLVLMTDSYKFTHWRQYPPGTQKVYSYIESRGGMFEDLVFFGLQYYLKRYVAGSVFTREDIEEADQFCRQHFGQEGYFNRQGWLELHRSYEGKLPLEIKAVPEGTVVPVSNVMMTVENTDPRFPWLTNYLETLLLKVWYPITVATLSREIKKVFLSHLERTGDPGLIGFKLHDFGYRGVSSEETAAVGAAAHLVNFQGTDTVAGIRLLQEYYATPGMPGFSIPAAEHSTITAWGREHERDAYRNMLQQFPHGMVACVSDSYDVFNACDHIWGEELREQVLSRDGVNYWTIQDVLTAATRAGWSADNIAFGMGGALLQQLNRDTQKFAFKCSEVTISGKEHEVYKEPVTDRSKGQKRGRLALVRRDHHFKTVTVEAGKSVPGGLLQTVFVNGEVKREQTLEDIRRRAEVPVSEPASR
ncbi:MAG TPA: nicotinate phosphoribosyltransferase [Terriglobales bacterium]|nr:nicotinate phosphoribosyltransferase [Terriglobales bacterium]